jgi:hypothetical protein
MIYLTTDILFQTSTFIAFSTWPFNGMIGWYDLSSIESNFLEGITNQVFAFSF